MKVNDSVSHKKFGFGTVLFVDGSKVLVAFADGERTISESFLELTESAPPALPANSFSAKPAEAMIMARNFRLADGEIHKTWVYIVCRWVWRPCPQMCDTYLEDKSCGHQNPFPIPFTVRLMTDRDGVVVRASCAQGRKGEKGPCQDEENPCFHVQRAMAKMADGEAELDRKSPLGRLSCDFRTVMLSLDPKPKCPNCNSKAFVKKHGDRFLCSSGTCMRPDASGRECPFIFSPGDGKLKPRWKFVDIREGFHWK